MRSYQAADVLHVNERSVRKMIARGALKATKVKNSWHINEEDLKGYIISHYHETKRKWEMLDRLTYGCFRK